MKGRIRIGRMRPRSSAKEKVVGLTVMILTLGFLQLLSLYKNEDDDEYFDYSLPRAYDERQPVVNNKYVLSAVVRERGTTTLNQETSNPGSLNMTSLPNNDQMTSNQFATVSDRLFRMLSYHNLLHGYHRTYKGFLTIGIPSIRRPGTNSQYLFETLTSIIKNTSPTDRPTVVVVVFLCDSNSTYNNEIGDQIYRKYKFYCDTGFMQITRNSPEMYPDLENVSTSRVESFDRVKWRTKQNIDFASLMLYAINISDYYMHLEDDVITSNDFVTDITRFINTNKYWFLLEFSNLGFIGKLFKSRDLEWVSWYLIRHYDVLPCDLLLGKIRKARGQGHPIHSEHGLFQHNGKYSSLRGKMMPSMDVTFKDSDMVNISMQQLPKGDNPKAEISTSFKVIEGYPAANAYDNNPDTYCWSKTPYRGDNLVLKFKRPWSFTRIVISTGNIARKEDSLRLGSLDVSVNDYASGNRGGHCGRFKSIASFVDGEIDTDIMNVLMPENMTCLRIRVTGSNRSWLILREIVLLT